MQIKALFWMQGDYIVTLCHCKNSHDYYLELFTFEDERPKGTVKVYNSQTEPTITTRTSHMKNFATLII